jgi:hypothetical protein
VLLTDHEAGALTLSGWYSTGERISEPPAIWAADVDGDAQLDLIVRAFNGSTVMHGHGDGSFDEGEPITQLGDVPAYFVGRADLDGDTLEEWVVAAHDGRPWAVSHDLSPAGIGPLAALNDPDAGGSNRYRSVAGDVNGDGVDDYVGGSIVDKGTTPYDGSFLMVSAP